MPDWLAAERVSLAMTTYQTGKLILLGLQQSGRLGVFERTFNRCMGLWGDGQTLWMNSLYQLWRFENVLQPGNLHNGHDRLYVPRVGYTAGRNPPQSRRVPDTLLVCLIALEAMLT